MLNNSQLQQYWENYTQACEQQQIKPIAADDDIIPTLYRVWAASQFVADYCARHPEWLLIIQRNAQSGQYQQQLQQHLAIDHLNEAQLSKILRQFRYQAMAHIAWRDLAGWATLDETLQNLSDLADSCVQATYDILYQWHCVTWGTPHNKQAQAQAQPLIILGMGKLGAYELNFSSDIDLIFAYPEKGETVGVRRRSNEEFFRSLCQRIIKILNSPTMDGFVYRVDTRLRPYGDSGPLAMNFDAMEQYYQTSGREWERYALIKARPMAGDIALGEQLLQRLKPFIYRRYTDFSVFESLREMKAMISREVKRQGLQNNIKLGPGGIREIEFIGQVFQLVHGGHEPLLQQRPILAILQVLANLELLPHAATQALAQAYIFLRHLENRLQAYADQQTHVLVDDVNQQAGIAHSMDYEHWDALMMDLKMHQSCVQYHFSHIFSRPEDEVGAVNDDPIWGENIDQTMAIAALKTLHYDHPDDAWQALQQFHQSSTYRWLSTAGRERLDRLMPVFIDAVAEASRSTQCLQRLLELLTVIARRTTYLSLLSENKEALNQLIKLSDASPWIVRQLQIMPLLLDQLLDSRMLYHPASKQVLTDQLEVKMQAIKSDDLEQNMEALRHFKQSSTLSIAAVDVMNVMPLMKISDALTHIAEVVLQQVVRLSQQDIAKRYGVCDVDFIVIGYGKLGGIELSYSSDLDLVFIHDSENGKQSAENTVYFARLSQRIIHYLSTMTHSGLLYEVDIRLRPNGQSGLPVSPLQAFIDYQYQQAWTWEHQALTRARAVAGSAALIRRFEQARQDILVNAVKQDKLQQAVLDMRAKMRSQLDKVDANDFHLKHSVGGSTDIEFIVQYHLLKYAKQYPELLIFSDNMRQLDALKYAGLMSVAQVAQLQTIYQAYRQQIHHLTLQEQAAIVPKQQMISEAQQVIQIWQQTFKE